MKKRSGYKNDSTMHEENQGLRKIKYFTYLGTVWSESLCSTVSFRGYWASTQYFDTYCIGEQRLLRRASA